MNNKIKVDDLLTVAKRENNQKRNFLYINPLQGKHIPVSPSCSFQIMELLAKNIENLFQGERLLIIAFSETATAIGTFVALASKNVKAFLTTTREIVNEEESIDFSEIHSHAAEQKLSVKNLEYWIQNTDRILFVEDEVTTGNTIKNLMTALQNYFPKKKLNFGIASLLNSMTDERISEFLEKKIPCTYLIHVPFGYRIHDIESIQYKEVQDKMIYSCDFHIEPIKINSIWNQRYVSEIEKVKSACNQFVEETIKNLSKLYRPMKLLIIGTEEFMYPGMLLGYVLEHRGYDVHFHATTRSPIEVSIDNKYPLHTRFSLKSLYDCNRKTYIYNLEKYDKVIIVTDAQRSCSAGVQTLVGAIKECGNTDINIVQWEVTDR